MQAKNPTKSASTGSPSQATLARHNRPAPSRFICSLVCLLILITHVDRTYGGVIITLRMEYTSAFDLEYYNSFGYESYQGTWEREIDFDSDDYDPNLGVAYADLLRVEDSFTSPSHSFLNYADRDASSSIGSSASRLYIGLIDFPSLQTTYQTFTQAGLQTGGPIQQSFTYVDQYYPSDRGFSHPFGTNPDGTVTSYWYGNIDYSGTDPDIYTSIEYLDNQGERFHVI